MILNKERYRHEKDRRGGEERMRMRMIMTMTIQLTMIMMVLCGQTSSCRTQLRRSIDRQWMEHIKSVDG